MITFGTLWIIVKLLIPLVFWGLILFNLPSIIGAIIGVILAVIFTPFALLFVAFRLWYQKKLRDKADADEFQSGSYEQFQEESYYQSSEKSDLYNLLGVKDNASKEEIKAAYKHKMMLNHPDRLATLDPELQKIASERTVAIKDAYVELLKSI